VGLHSISKGSLLHAVVGKKGDLTFDDLGKKHMNSKPIQMKGDHVHKSYLG